MAVQLSAFVITKNEEQKIARCLAALSFVNEIIVLDSGSTDATVALAKKFTKKIFIQKFKGYGPQKQAAIDKCTNNWVLEVDADEIVTSELVLAITKLISDSALLEQHAAYALVRQEFFMGKPLMKSLIPRLYRKDKVSYHELIHEKLRIDGSLGKLPGLLLHESDNYETLSDRVQKNNTYTTQEAARLFALHPSFFSVILKLFVVPLLYFFWFYLAKGLIFCGKRGLIWSLLTAHYHFLIYSKVYEYIYKQKAPSAT